MRIHQERIIIKLLRTLLIFIFLSQSAVFGLSPHTSMAVHHQYVSDFIPAPIEFPNAKTDKVQEGTLNVFTDRWLLDRLVIKAVLEDFQETGTPDKTYSFEFNRIREKLESLLINYERSESVVKNAGKILNKTLKKLIDNNVISYDDGIYTLVLSPRILAIWGDDMDFIYNDLRAVLKMNNDDIIEALTQYAKATSLQELFPIESRYPVKRPINLLSSQLRTRLAKVVEELRDNPELYNLDLINDIDLQLNKDSITAWIEKVCPDLKDVSIYDLTPEFSEVGGGLGRVEQYHITWMKKLGANVIAFEPRYYNFKRNGQEVLSDYSKASYPVTFDKQEDITSINFEFNGETVPLKIRKGINNKEVPVLQVFPDDSCSDFIKSGFHRMYAYGNGRMEPYQFSALLAKAQWTYIRDTEFIKFQKQGKNWKPPVVNTNDAQTLLSSVYRLIDYNEEVRNNGESDYADFLRSFMFSATTHTYRNRGFFAKSVILIFPKRHFFSH